MFCLTLQSVIKISTMFAITSSSLEIEENRHNVTRHHLCAEMLIGDIGACAPNVLCIA
jgi:hypothetical protein